MITYADPAILAACRCDMSAIRLDILTHPLLPPLRHHSGDPDEVRPAPPARLRPAGLQRPQPGRPLRRQAEQFRRIATRCDKLAVDYLAWGHAGRHPDL